MTPRRRLNAAHVFKPQDRQRIFTELSVRVPGCQKLQMTAEPGQAQDTL